MNRYYYASGLRHLAAELAGDEVIHAGARPYDLHAGNRIPLVVYPTLLAEALAARGRTPRFRYVVTLNDWDTDGLVGKSGAPLSFRPHGTTFQYRPDPAGCCATLVDHWERRFWREIAPLRAAYPQIDVTTARASTLARQPGFLEILRFALYNRAEVGRALSKAVGQAVDERDCRFAGVVCPRCHAIDGQTIDDAANGHVRFACDKCNAQVAGALLDFDWWLYVHVLGAAKYAALAPDVWIFGGDFVEHGTLNFLDRMIELATGTPPRMKHLITPILRGSDGEKMSKSRGNYLEVPSEVLFRAIRLVDTPYASTPQAGETNVALSCPYLISYERYEHPTEI